MSDVEHLEDVDWQVDADGTEYFEHEGVRYELAEDGYAYAVETPDDGQDAATSRSDVTVRIVADDLPGGDDDEPTPGEPARAEAPTTAIPLPGSRRTHRADASSGDRNVPSGTTTSPPYASPKGRASGVTDAPVDTLLQLEQIRSGYGALPVLHGVDLEIGVGQTAVLFGLNGAGKTTTAMNIAGALDTWGGHIRFDGQDATGWSTRKAVSNGIVMVPEGRKVFPELDVARNLQVGSWLQRKDRSWVNEQREQVLEYFPRLRERLAQAAGTLSGGEQQMLAIARGLMARPRLLIIDEASMGLAPVIVNDVFEIVRQINQDGVTVLLIEQNVGALEVADRGIVMAQGRVVTELTGTQLEDRSVVSELLMG